MTPGEIANLVEELEKAVDDKLGRSYDLHAKSLQAIRHLKGQRDAMAGALWALAVQAGGSTTVLAAAMEGYSRPGARLVMKPAPLGLEVTASAAEDRT